MCQHRVCKASWGPPHNGRNVGDRSGGTGHGGQQRAGRQGGLTKDRRRAGRAPKTSGTGHKLQRQHSESLTNAGEGAEAPPAVGKASRTDRHRQEGQAGLSPSGHTPVSL